MSGPVQRWVEVTPSQFSHESEGLNLVRALLPDVAPFRAWSNFEFRDSQGKWHEVDLLVLGRRRLHLVELKYYSGTLSGDDHRWLRDGKRAEDSPLKLARRKAQRLASKLREEFIAWAASSSAQVPDVRDVVPFVQECVFLHHPGLRCELSGNSRIDLYAPAASAAVAGLAPIEERLLEAPDSSGRGIHDTIVAELMRKIGVVQRREREAGSWVVQEQPLAEGDGWQDWVAHHRVAVTDRAKIRFFVTNPGATSGEKLRIKRLAEHEYRVMSRLSHDGLLRPRDIVDTELGIGLVYPDDGQYRRLDLWLAEQPDGVPIGEQLTVVRRTAEALAYAHANRVVHRGLTPSAVQVRAAADGLRVRVGDWQAAGSANGAAAAGSAVAGVTALVAADQADRAQVDPDRPLAEAFEAPEGVWNRQADRVRLDVFALGALAYYVLAGRPAAAGRSALRDRLRRDDGLDLAADLPEVSSAVRAIVLEATRPNVSARLPDVTSFLALLDDAERELCRDEGEDLDPLEAPAGSVLDGRFRISRRLGTGSTAVGLLVTDLGVEGEPERVLKVALDDPAAGRLRGEAEVLAGLDHPRLVRLVEGPITVGGRVCLVLDSAGDRTLAEEIRGRAGLSLDLLERYGTDLIEALVALDRAGVDHRDIKPANLGVRKGRGDRAKHLVLFDFSLSRAPADSVQAGTPPYLDPFLDTADRGRYDSAAELYSAAVVLFEMATGHPPTYGDGQSHPLSIPDEASIDPGEFDPSLAPRITEFFARALAREARTRFDTANELLAAWRAVFDALATQVPDVDRVDAAGPATPLAESGLSARALSALQPLGVGTVGDLVAVDAWQLSRMRGVAEATRREVTERARTWRERYAAELLGRPAMAVPVDDSVLTLAGAAGDLVERAGGQRAKARALLAQLLLGVAPGRDAFATQAELAEATGVTRARISQLLDQLQQAWAANTTTRALLGSVAASARSALVELGGVATLEELTGAVEAEFPPTPTGEEPSGTRLAAGLLRLALERDQYLAPTGDQVRLSSRRRDGRIVLFALDPFALDAAEALARAADTLVNASAARGESVVPAARVAETLTAAASKAGLATPLSDERLVRVAVALTRVAVRTGADGLHHRELQLPEALRLTLGTAAGEIAPLPPNEIRDRVRTQFPALPPVPERPRLDELLREARLDLVFDETARAFRAPQRTVDTTGFATRTLTRYATAPSTGVGGHVGERLDHSRSARSFLALGVPASRLDRVAQALVDRYAAVTVDITGVLVEALRAQAAAAGVPWDVVRAADAAEPGSRDAQGLAGLVARAVPSVDAAVETACVAAAPGTRPVLLTEAAPLARYDHINTLARWTELTTSRSQAVWLLVPQLQGASGPLLDGRPLPLSATGQFVKVDDQWLAGILAAPASA